MESGASPLLLGVAGVAALGVAWRSRSIASAAILVPANGQASPMPAASGEPLEFRFTTLGAWGSGTWTPRGLLALLFFTFFALALRLVVGARGDWSGFLEQLAIWILVGALLFGGPALALVVALGVPACVIGAAFDNTPQGYGIGLGILFGALAGAVAGINYVLLLNDTRMEARVGRTRHGAALGPLARAWRVLNGFFLALVPLAVLYEVVRFVRPEVDGAPQIAAALAPTLGEDGALWAAALAMFALGINVVFYAVPMFVEILERASLMAASGFADHAKRHLARKEELARTGAEPSASDKSDEEFLKNYLGPRGEWAVSGGMQALPLLVITILFACNTIESTLEALLRAGLTEPQPSIAGLGVILGWITFFSNAVFLLIVLVRRPFGAPANAAVEALWTAAEHPGSRLCFVGPPGALRMEASGGPAAAVEEP